MSETVRPALQIVASVLNSTTATLAGSGAFIGTGENVQGYQEIDINVFVNPRGASGTLFFEFSPDNVNWDVSVPVLVDDGNIFIPFPLRVILPWFRVRYVNESVAQTAFRLTTVFHVSSSTDLTRLATQTIGPNEPLKVTRSLIETSLLGDRGILGADRSVFGAGVTMGQVAQIIADFSAPLANNSVTSTVTGSGATAQATGQATMTTGATATSSARLQSNTSTRTSPGDETFALFTARFTVPTSANSEQRAGLFDDNNGMFVGYHGLAFGFTTRTGGVDTFTPLTAVNGDPLDGTAFSRFTRGGDLEPIDPTLFNEYRLRLGGKSDVSHFEVQSPDGTWMRVHTIRQPNMTAAVGFQSLNLPLRMEATKTAADATSLVIGTGTWNAGFIGDPFGLEPYDTHGRVAVQGNVLVTGAAAPVSTLLFTVPAGRRLRLTDLTVSADVKVGSGGEMQLIDTATGTTTPILWRYQIIAVANQFVSVSHPFRTPLPFTIGLTFLVPTQLGSTFSVVYAGYTEIL